MCCAKYWIAIGAVAAGLAVVAGAFGAHWLDDLFAKKYMDAPPKTISGFEVPASWKYLNDFKTGAEYQMYHALGILAAGLLMQTRARKSLQAAAWCFLGGIVHFSGSLYMLTLTGQTKWGMIAPIGGTLFIVGWVLLAIGALAGPTPQSD